MIRAPRFLISRRLYAIDPTSLQVGDATSTGHHWAMVDSVWFRRRRGVTVACTGRLRDLQDTPPLDACEFLARYTDGRYGGDCTGRWDGTTYWGHVPLAVQEQHLAVLRPMLDRYPAAPAGFDGWWAFEPTP